MKIVRVKQSGQVYLYQTKIDLVAGDRVIVQTGRGTIEGEVVSDSISVPPEARTVFAYVVSTYRKRPLKRVLALVLGDVLMDKSTAEGEENV